MQIKMTRNRGFILSSITVLLLGVCGCILLIPLVSDWLFMVEGELSITAINNLETDICELYIKEDLEHLPWGRNRINAPLMPGQSVSISGLAEGGKRGRAIGCDSETWLAVNFFDVQGSNSLWRITPPTVVDP